MRRGLRSLNSKVPTPPRSDNRPASAQIIRLHVLCEVLSRSKLSLVVTVHACTMAKMGG